MKTLNNTKNIFMNIENNSKASDVYETLSDRFNDATIYIIDRPITKDNQMLMLN